ncbi:hypothetical protein FB45DRAFT_843761 [Roridomyces roridus]|uniref:Polysaccharide lyase 14 domain-containing protein n=1 Tax=Roridomyces roridus TaxID=1738132 RepID=A0AAD7B5Z6_9AGAR|nr:hypothetical protein FB45DRAFT_843761 [Roridomyces roridus]
MYRTFPVARDDSNADADADDPLLVVPGQIVADITTLLPLPLDQITSALGDVNSALYLFPPSSPPPASTIVVTATEILTVTEAPKTVTVAAPPSTTSSSTTDSSLRKAKAAWSAPAQMTDLSAFNITYFSAGRQNLRLVNGIPASASACPSPSSTPPRPSPTSTTQQGPLFGLDSILQASSSSPYTAWDNKSTVMQIFYPKGSANPAAKPVGGSQFYASPLPQIANADTVSMTYSLFLPADFDPVLGGKLPGLYGGKMSCSGGDAAVDCWSTRLMWREGCAGELYLYAPKDKQTRALCAAKGSHCNAEYGFSVGRGSFYWLLGGWTTVMQVVRLNTPGKQDGGFILYVNGKKVIERNDVFYRDVPPSGARTMPTTKSTSTTADDGGGGLLSPLNPLLGGILQERPPLLLPAPTGTGGLLLIDNDVRQKWAVQIPIDSAVSSTVNPGPTYTVMTTVTVYPTAAPNPEDEQAAPRTTPAGFSGIFFRRVASDMPNLANFH